MEIKKKKWAKRCAYCIHFSSFRGAGGLCSWDWTRISSPHESVCEEKNFSPKFRRIDGKRN
jgi:hypothetical protein